MATKGIRAMVWESAGNFLYVIENWLSVLLGERVPDLDSHLQSLAWVFMH